MEATAYNRESLKSALKNLRACQPLIHCVTNFVTMDFIANSLLALGASPIMAHAPEECASMVGISNALLLNIGTLEEAWIHSMRLAGQAAAEQNKPIVLDPAGAGATPYRTQTALSLLSSFPITAIRGNASEIQALAGQANSTKGTESHAGSDAALDAAARLVNQYNCAVIITGKIDYIVSKNACTAVPYGHALMKKVVGMGCVSSAVVAAFLGCSQDPRAACAHALATMGLCADHAFAAGHTAAGSFKVGWLDALYTLEQ